MKNLYNNNYKYYYIRTTDMQVCYQRVRALPFSFAEFPDIKCAMCVYKHTHSGRIKSYAAFEISTGWIFSYPEIKEKIDDLNNVIEEEKIRLSHTFSFNKFPLLVKQFHKVYGEAPLTMSDAENKNKLVKIFMHEVEIAKQNKMRR